MAQAQTPRGINHVVLNVRDIEVSHRFWAEVMGFLCVAGLKPRPDRVRPKMRFYSGVADNGDLSHHDLALAEAPRREGGGEVEPETWSLTRGDAWDGDIRRRVSSPWSGKGSTSTCRSPSCLRSWSFASCPS